MDLLTKMATYVRVVEAGNLSAAAKQLRVSPAAVSRQLATLEDELGAQLVARTTRKMTVTPAGRDYYERCLRILREVDDAQALGRTSGLSGALHINAPITFGLASLVPKLRTIALAQPALRIDLRLDDRIVDLALEGVDIAIRVASAPPISTEIVAHEIFAWQRVLVASPAYLRRRGVPRAPADLARHDALSHAIDTGEMWQLVKGETTERVRLSVRCSSNVGHVLRDMALEGAGIAILPPWFLTEELAAKRLRIVLPGWGSERIHVHAIYRARHRHELRVRELVDQLRAAYAA